MSDFFSSIQDIFINPSNGKDLKLITSQDKLLGLSERDNQFSLIDGVISFEDSINYTSNFGDQWNKFRRTQIDSFNGTSLSETRFFDATGWNREELEGKLVLDIGCGAGRFAEIALKYGANVVAVDYSDAVYAAAKNLSRFNNLIIIKGNIYNLPFKKNIFDYIYCLGVIQHTPDPEKAFKVLPSYLKSEGKFCADFYWKRMREYIKPKYYVRLITKYFKEDEIYRFLLKFHPAFYSLANLIYKIPVFGSWLVFLLPIKYYRGSYPQLNEQQLYEWSLLDTYDNWAPTYDYPQTISSITKWANESGLKKYRILHAGHLVIRSTK